MNVPEADMKKSTLHSPSRRTTKVFLDFCLTRRMIKIPFIRIEAKLMNKYRAPYKCLNNRPISASVICAFLVQPQTPTCFWSIENQERIFKQTNKTKERKHVKKLTVVIQKLDKREMEQNCSHLRQNVKSILMRMFSRLPIIYIHIQIGDTSNVTCSTIARLAFILDFNKKKKLRYFNWIYRILYNQNPGKLFF